MSVAQAKRINTSNAVYNCYYKQAVFIFCKWQVARKSLEFTFAINWRVLFNNGRNIAASSQQRWIAACKVVDGSLVKSRCFNKHRSSAPGLRANPLTLLTPKHDRERWPGCRQSPADRDCRSPMIAARPIDGRPPQQGAVQPFRAFKRRRHGRTSEQFSITQFRLASFKCAASQPASRLIEISFDLAAFRSTCSFDCMLPLLLRQPISRWKTQTSKLSLVARCNRLPWKS